MAQRALEANQANQAKLTSTQWLILPLLGAAAWLTFQVARKPATDSYQALRNHPRSLPQETLGFLVAVCSWGRRSREDGIILYENCIGACSFLKLMDVGAITLGHNVFAEGELSRRQRLHEKVHVRQGDENGLLWIPRYLWEQATKGYRCNRFEEEARRIAGEASRCPKGTD